MKSGHSSTIFKKAQGLLIQQIGQETLVYNESLHKAFCLNPIAAQVWQLLDGVRTSAQIAVAMTDALSTPVTEDLVLLALAELRADGLVEEEYSPAGVMVAPSRRDMMRQLGLGAAVLLPVVAAVMAPQAAQAYTGCLNCNVAAPVVNSRVKQQAAAQQQAQSVQSTPAQQQDPGFANPTLMK